MSASDSASFDTIYIWLMHIQIRQDRPRNCPLCRMALEPLMPDLDDENPELEDFRRRVDLALRRKAADIPT